QRRKRAFEMARREHLEKIVKAAGRIANAETGGDSAGAQPLGDRGDGAIDKFIARRDVPVSGGHEPAVAEPGAEAEVDSRLDNVPSVDQEHDCAAMPR